MTETRPVGRPDPHLLGSSPQAQTNQHLSMDNSDAPPLRKYFQHRVLSVTVIPL